MPTLSLKFKRIKLPVEARLPEALRPFENSARRRTTVPLCGDAVERLLEANPDLTVGPSVERLLDRQRDDHRRAREAADDTSSRDLLDRRLRPHQRSGARWLSARGRALLADAQGTGKTVTALAAAAREATSVLVACSKTKRPDWVRHVRVWTKFEPRIVEASDEVGAIGRGEALVMTYAAAAEFKHLRPDLLIIDEAHVVRNRKTAGAADLRTLARKARLLYLLTATPIVNKPGDIWPLLRMIDEARFGSYWDFAMRFLDVQRGRFGVKVGSVRAEEEERFWRLLGEHMLQRPKDLTILPPITKQVIPYHMPKDQAALYRAILDTDAAEFGGEHFETVEMIAKITRLRQLALDPRLVWPSYRGGSKLDALVDLESGRVGQTVVFTMFAQFADLAAQRLNREGITARAFTGEMSARARQEALDAFAAGRTRVLILTFKTGGEGLDLVTADRVVFLDLAWHPAGNAQARDRIHRYGQTAETVEAIYIKTVNSIEDEVLAILRMKEPVTIERLSERLGTISS